MSTRAFRRKPPFRIPDRARTANLPCDPKISTRGTHPTHYPEFSMFPGPQALAVTGDNTFDTLFGRAWAILFCGNHDFYLLQWTDGGEGAPPGLEAGGWSVMTDPLLTLPEFTGREQSFTGAFDQSARLIIAYELDGAIRVTRWDPDVSAYRQNVNFEGADPTLLMDASITRRVPDSDVLLFYVSADRTSVHYRAQRDLYGVERDLLWSGDEEEPVVIAGGLVLDQALALWNRFMLLVGRSTGARDPLALVSDWYPIQVADGASITLTPAGGEYRQEIVQLATADALAVTLGPVEARHVSMIDARSAEVALAVTLEPASGAHTRTITVRDEALALALEIAPAEVVFDRTTFDHARADPITLALAPARGEYRATS